MRIAFALLVFFAARSVSAQAGVPNADLVGLWGTESVSGPQLRGPLTLERGAAEWTLRIGGFEVSSPFTGDSIAIELPGGQGQLRARTSKNAVDIRAFWIQPQGQVAPQPFATPLVLHRAAANSWRGTVRPIDDRWSLYLLIRRAPDGSLRGAFRNPDANWRGGASSFRIKRDSDTLRLLDTLTGKQLNSVLYDSASQRITMDFGRPIILEPRSRDQAVGFYARTPVDTSYEYRTPLALNDGWSTSTPAAVDLETKPLRDMVRMIESVDPVAPGAPLIHSILVERHGSLVLDEYFYGFDDSRTHDMRSASKTFTSIMTGIAIDRGLLRGVDEPVYAGFPNASALVAAEPRRRRITLAQLLTHSSGLACDDMDDDSPGNEDRMQSAKTDWYDFILALPVAHDPGTTYAYCSGGINLAAGMLAKATHSWLPEFFDRNVAAPMQITDYGINLMPSHQMYGGGGMQLRPRDLLKFGELFLKGGSWKDHRVVSRAWVNRSTAHQIDASNGSSDGFAWHRYTLSANGRSYREYEASGNGGQLLIVLPELDMAVVFTAGNFGQYGIWRKFRDEMIAKYVIAAVQMQ